MNFRKLLTYLAVGTAAVIPFAGAQNPTILQGNYISNVFGQSNFILNPNAQTNIANVTVSNATVTRSTTTPLVATSEFNITTSTATGYADWATRTFDAGMKNQNCEARFTYRGFSVGSTTVQIRQGSNTVAQLTLTTSTDPRIASINFPCGDLSSATTLRVQQATASLTGTNEIGGLYLGLATNQANVAQAEEVGSYEVAGVTNCNWTRTGAGSNTFGNFSANANCGTGIVTGAADTSQGKIPGARFNNLKPGKYMFIVDYTLYKAGTLTGNVRARLSDGTNTSTSLVSLIPATSDTTAPATSVLTVEYTSVTSPTIQLQGYTQETTNTVLIFNSETPQKFKLTAYRFPTSSELVVTPERQNVFGGARWSGNIDSSLVASTAEATLNTTNFGSPAAFGKAQVTSLTDCGLVANDIGFCLKNVPPGTYQFSANLQLGAVGPGGTPGQAVCNAFGVVSGTSLSATKVAQAFATNGGTTTSEDWTNLPTGLITISSFQSNLAVYITRSKTTANGACIIRSANVSNVTLPALQLIPVDQPSNSALYVQGPVLGSQTGAAIPASYVGEVKQSAVTSGITASNTRTAVTSIVLTPGVWRVHGVTNIDAAIPGYGDLEVSISPDNTSTATWFNRLTNGTLLYPSNAAIGQLTHSAATAPVYVHYDGTNLTYLSGGVKTGSTAGNTIYLKVRSVYTTLYNQWHYMVAERIN